MKQCSKCGIESENFGFHRGNKDKLNSWCRSCKNEGKYKFYKTKEGFISIIYSSQILRSKNRNHCMPSYSLEELRCWVFSQDNFEELYSNWVESGYDKMKKPSVDRLDDYKGYSFDNIQLMTWQENKYKSHMDIKNGINNKLSKAVVGKHKITGEKIEFYSQSEASRETGVNQQNINACCLGKRKTAGGYIWKYKN